MPREAEQHPSPQDLYRVAEEVARSGRRQELRFNGATLTIGRLPTEKPARCHRRENSFLAAYGSVRPLNPPLSDREMAEIAAEDAAERCRGWVASPYARYILYCEISPKSSSAMA